MKNSTKYKIIQWVTRLLKYYPPMEIPYQTKVFEIKTVEISESFNSKRNVIFFKGCVKITYPK